MDDTITWEVGGLRIKITMQKKDFTLPIAYKHAIQGTIYHMFPKTKEGEFFHDEGYRIENKVFKMFTFSDLKGKYSIVDRKIIFDEYTTLYIASLNEEFIRYIYDYLCRNSILFINHQEVKVVSIDIEDLQPFSGIQKKTIITLSPVTAYKTENRYTTYYKPSDDEFENLVLENIKKKAEAYGYPLETLHFHVINVDYEKKQLIKFKNTLYEAYRIRMSVEADYDTLSIIYNTGLSSKGSCGFGMIEVADEKDNLFV